MEESKVLINQKQKLYNQVLSLVEDEVSSRLNNNPGQIIPINKTTTNIVGGNNGNNSNNVIKTNFVSSYVPGKLDIIRNAYKLDLSTALRGTLERQKLFINEKQNNNKY